MKIWVANLERNGRLGHSGIEQHLVKPKIERFGIF
jgi:hypothetical protein